jgi:methylated-DNA-[protein]-cysteine S-methyltransferase
VTAESFALFETAIGPCGIAWTAHGVAGVQLPELPPAETGSRLSRRFPDAAAASPPDWVARAIADIQALLTGGAIDLSAVPLDLSAVPALHRRIYAIARAIPPGRTMTYGEIAAALGQPDAARAVGQAMGSNPFPILMPCHRVLAAGDLTGGFSAPGGTATKLKLLEIEAAPAARSPFILGAVEPAPSAQPGLFDAQSPCSFDALAAVVQLRQADPVLAALIDRVGPLRLQVEQRSSLFLALAEAIIYQQLTAKAAATIFGRVKALFKQGLDGPSAEQILLVEDETLRGAGLSRAKTLALRDLARRSLSGDLPSLVQLGGMEDEAIIAALSAIRGIGRWTAQMLLIFRLGRPDVLPADDYGLRKAYGLVFGTALPGPRELAAAGERWAPFRSAASWYLWRALEQDDLKSSRPQI